MPATLTRPVTAEHVAELLALPRAAAPAAVAAPAAPTLVRKPPLRWRLRQTWKLLRDGSYLVPLYARVARRLGLVAMYGELRGVVYHADGTATNYGLLGRRVVTTAGVTFLAGAFDNTNEPETLQYHGFGTGGSAEATGNTALTTELTTEYAVNNTRPTGTNSKSTNTFSSVGTLSPDANVTITEHGLFNQASNAGGTLWDRTLFSGIALVGSSDSLQATYTGTFPAGS